MPGPPAQLPVVLLLTLASPLWLSFDLVCMVCDRLKIFHHGIQ